MHSSSIKKDFVTQDQIEEARRLDLFSYLQQYEPDELIRIKGDVYCTRTHDSLKISNGKWFWWSRGFGGRSALDYLVKVCEVDFVEAVKHLNDHTALIQPCVYAAKPKTPTPFKLPERNKNNDKVIAYLMARGIKLSLIKVCINRKILYEDARHNCCFVGFDGYGMAQYATLRSSNPHSTFLGDVDGSKKEYSFQLPINPMCDTLYVFESAIDLLSFATLRMQHDEDVTFGNYLSLSGVYQPRKELRETPLPTSLVRFLKENKHIRRISLRMDNDKAGQIAADTIQVLLNGRYEVTYDPPEHEKDYNAMLMQEVGLSGVKMRKSSEKTKEETR